MKKLSEVCKIAGVTRQTLRGYEKKELLVPTSKTRDGWLYDDNALARLRTILIFVEAGYTREEIKEILALPWNEYVKIFDTVIEKLEEKKRRINGMIQTVKMMKNMGEFPDNVMDSLTRADFSKLNNGKPYASVLKESLSSLGSIPEEYREMLSPFMTLMTLLIAIGCMNNEDAGSEKVLACVTDYCNYFMEVMPILMDIEQKEINETPSEEWLARIVIYTDELLSNETYAEMIENCCGSKSRSFIQNALEEFGAYHYTKEKFEALLDKARREING